jgi:prepilin-type N-terminal cleavage/methylation domain-containing protein/prepilin-type processing-associated H-X9-DG protein
VPKHPQPTQGFTLTELLVVVAVLAMLLAIVAPIVRKGMSVGRRIKCASNLKRIGQAYHLCVNDDEQNTLDDDPISPDMWTQTLQPYLKDDGDAVTLCPEDKDPAYGNIDVSLQIWVQQPRPGMPTEYAIELFNMYPYWLEDGCPDPGPGVWKLNNEMYSEFNSKFVGTQFYAPSWLPQYSPGSDPDSWWLVVEEGRSDGGGAGSDMDYNDLLIHVTRQPDGTLQATFERTWFWVDYGLIMPDGELIGGEGNSLGASIPGPITLPASNKASYGMNWQAPEIGRGLGKVLMLDYERQAVKVGGSVALHEDWDLTVAPRHKNGTQVNASFLDGSVTAHTPDEIDPDIIANDERFWSP